MMKFVREQLSPEELELLRRRTTFTVSLCEKVAQVVILLASKLLNDHPNVKEMPSLPQMRETFLFRSALCTYALVLKGIEHGGLEKRPEKLRNTMVDATFAAFATYFDGLMSKDQTACTMHADAEFLLREVFAKPPIWLRWLLSYRRLRSITPGNAR